MRKTVYGLSALLGISVLVNIMALSKLSGARKTTEGSREQASSLDVSTKKETKIEAASNKGDFALLIRKIARLEEKIDSLQGEELTEARINSSSPSTSTSTSPAPEEDLLYNDPEIALLMEEQKRNDKFWMDLGKLSRFKTEMSEKKYQDVLFKMTKEFLQMSERRADSLKAELPAAVALYQQAYDDYYKAYNTLPRGKKYGQNLQELSQRLNEATKRATEPIKRALDENRPREKDFIKRLHQWLQYAVPKGTGVPQFESRLGMSQYGR